MSPWVDAGPTYGDEGGSKALNIQPVSLCHCPLCVAGLDRDPYSHLLPAVEGDRGEEQQWHLEDYERWAAAGEASQAVLSPCLRQSWWWSWALAPTPPTRLLEWASGRPWLPCH